MGVIVILITVALSGLVILQTYLLTKSMEQKDEAFGRNVWSVLGAVTQSLESTELKDQIRFSTKFGPDQSVEFFTENVTSDYTCGDSITIEALWTSEWNSEPTRHSPVQTDNPLPIHFHDDTLYYSLPQPQHILVKVMSPDHEDAVVLVDTFSSQGAHYIDFSRNEVYGEMFMMQVSSDSSTYYMMVNEDSNSAMQMPSADGPKDRMIRRIVNQLAFAEFESIEDRVDMTVLDSLVASSLNESDLDLDYEFGVVTKDSVLLASSEDHNDELLNSEFRAKLFPHDFFGNENYLAVYFPEKEAFILGKMIPLFGSSLLFVSLIVICFVIALRSVVGQKRFASHLIDFINNMTHEFKTPIATVALASEAIQRDDVKADLSKVDRYNTMIRDENQRMRTQVDKILQMALIEEGEVELKVSRLDLHAVIADAMRSIALSVESRTGRLVSDLSAENSIINGDSVHVSSIVKNLLDNANKYSPDSPEIVVKTSEAGDTIRMSVSDNGIGIDEQFQKFVFDKYYRVPSGNQHDVKGFGLGLSYVKIMVEAHAGTINLNSSPGRGTTVTVNLPLAGVA